MPQTSTAAQEIVQHRLEPQAAADDGWHSSADGARHWWSQLQPDLPQGIPRQGGERWVVARTRQGEERARATLQRQADREQATWEKRLWHLGHQTFACQPDAAAALTKACERLPAWLQVQSAVSSHLSYPTRGRPRKDDAASAPPVWQIQGLADPGDAEARSGGARARGATPGGLQYWDQPA